jgi:hypothetical protein
MHRLFRLTAVLTVAFMVFAGLKVQPVAAAQDGLTGDTSYESPKFGYEVEWTSDWEVIADFTTSGESTDSLRIYNEEYGSWIDIWGFESNNRDEATFLESYIGLLEDSDSYANIEVTEQDSADPGAVAVILNYELGDNATPIEDYIEVRTVGNALVLTSLKAGPGFSLIVAILAMSQVTIDGDSLFPSLGAAEEDDNSSSSTDDEEDDNSSSSNDDEEDDNNSSSSNDDEEDNGSSSDDEDSGNDDNGGQVGVDGGTYVSPTFGVYLEFDEDAWEVVDEVAAEDSENERDLLLLQHTDLPINLYLEGYDSVTRASACIESASEEAYGDADAEPLEDEDGEVIEGSSRGVAYAAYAWENEDGDELAGYIECRALPEGAGVFVITMITLQDDYEDAFAEVSDILDTIDLEGGSSASSSSDDEEDDNSSSSNDDEEDNGSSSDDEEDNGSSSDDEGAAAGEYESPTYGFVISYDEDAWEQTDDSSQDDVDTVEFEGEDDVLLTVTAYEAGRRDDPESCVQDQIDEIEFDVVTVTVGDDEEPAEGDTDFGYYSIVAYENEDGDQRAVYVQCGASPDEDYLVAFVADGPWDTASDMIGAVDDMVEEVDF